jgi:hypothetical protein
LLSIFLLHFSFPDSSAYRCRKRQAKSAAPEKKSENLLVDIQAKLRAGKGVGYARWATLFNLKQMAQTVAFCKRMSFWIIPLLQRKQRQRLPASAAFPQRSSLRKHA